MVAAFAGLPCKAAFARGKPPAATGAMAAGGEADEAERATGHHGAGHTPPPAAIPAWVRLMGAFVQCTFAGERRRQRDGRGSFSPA